MRAESKKNKPAKPMKLRIWRNRGLYILLIPMLVYFILFNVLPIWGLQIAFRDFKPVLGITGSPWVGLKYIKKFVTSYSFWTLLRNTLVLSVYCLVICLPLAMFLAIVLKYLPMKRTSRFIQVASYAPHFISMVVLVGMLKTFLMPGSGVVNVILAKLGKNTIDFMGNPNYFPHLYAWTKVWSHLGFNAIIFIAGLTSVSEDLHEAAIVDGADKMQRIWNIDIPSIMPMMIILMIMEAGNLLNVGFEKAFLMQTASNLGVSEIISTYTYKMGLLSTQYSYASAIGLFNNVINCIVLVIVNKVAQKTTESSLW